jgi:3-methyladenine DNA glycosylase AlkD
MLQEVASPAKKEWWEKYLRNVIPFRGVGIPEIRKQLAVWREVSGVAEWTTEDQLGIALRLFEEPLAEDKLAGILLLQEYLYDEFSWQDLLPKYEALYSKQQIFDWNTCDWFCVRVLGPTIALHGHPCAQAIAAWRTSVDLWQARSSVVAFVKVAAEQQYYPLIYESCAMLTQREERFAKTAVGWILREISRYDRNGVERFVAEHVEHFSNEALRNALKYLNQDE